MNKLKMQLFLATLRSAKLVRRLEDSKYGTELEIIAAKSKYQTFYRFLMENGLEDEYLSWRESLKE